MIEVESQSRRGGQAALGQWQNKKKADQVPYGKNQIRGILQPITVKGKRRAKDDRTSKPGSQKKGDEYKKQGSQEKEDRLDELTLRGIFSWGHNGTIPKVFSVSPHVSNSKLWDWTQEDTGAGHVDYSFDEIKTSPFGKQTSISKILEV